MTRKKKVFHNNNNNNNNNNKDNLHFIPNNILTNFFKKFNKI